jgi:hypothetical protein
MVEQITVGADLIMLCDNPLLRHPNGLFHHLRYGDSNFSLLLNHFWDSNGFINLVLFRHLDDSRNLEK